MRSILALAMLALTLAGGIMTFIASDQAQARHHQAAGCEGEMDEDGC